MPMSSSHFHCKTPFLMSGDMVPPNTLIRHVESTNSQKNLLWCEKCRQCICCQYQLLLSLNPWWCCSSNSLIHHPLSWIACTLLSDWVYCIRVVGFSLLLAAIHPTLFHIWSSWSLIFWYYLSLPSNSKYLKGASYVPALSFVVGGAFFLFSG